MSEGRLIGCVLMQISGEMPNERTISVSPLVARSKLHPTSDNVRTTDGSDSAYQCITKYSFSTACLQSIMQGHSRQRCAQGKKSSSNDIAIDQKERGSFASDNCLQLISIVRLSQSVCHSDQNTRASSCLTRKDYSLSVTNWYSIIAFKFFDFFENAVFSRHAACEICLKLVCP